MLLPLAARKAPETGVLPPLLSFGGERGELGTTAELCLETTRLGSAGTCSGERS